jgi:hypothetical protein
MDEELWRWLGLLLCSLAMRSCDGSLLRVCCGGSIYAAYLMLICQTIFGDNCTSELSHSPFSVREDYTVDSDRACG